MKGPQKLKIELPYDPSIPLLGVYPQELILGFQRNHVPEICYTTLCVNNTITHT